VGVYREEKRKLLEFGKNPPAGTALISSYTVPPAEEALYKPPPRGLPLKKAQSLRADSLHVHGFSGGIAWECRKNLLEAREKRFGITGGRRDEPSVRERAHFQGSKLSRYVTGSKVGKYDVALIGFGRGARP